MRKQLKREFVVALQNYLNIYLETKWASLMAQMVKNLPAMQEIWVRSLGREELLEECMATHSSILAWRTPIASGAWWATVRVVAKSLS